MLFELPLNWFQNSISNCQKSRFDLISMIYLFLFQKKWNLVLIFEDDGNKESISESLELNLQQYNWIQDIEITPFTSRPLYASIINGLIVLKSRLCSTSSSICGSKLSKFHSMTRKQCQPGIKDLSQSIKIQFSIILTTHWK